MITRHNLKLRGWTEPEIKHAMKILEKAEQKKHPLLYFLDEFVYWSALFLAMVASFVIALYIVPLSIAVKSSVLYFIVIILGVSFGFLFVSIVRNLENLTTRHYATFIFVIPVVGLIMFWFVIQGANNIGRALSFFQHNPVALGATYVISFLAPYILLLAEKKI